MKDNKKQKIQRIFTKTMQKKLAVLFLIIMLALIGLNVRLTYIGAESGKQYTKKVLSQQEYDSRALPYRRGDIVDRTGTKLATSEKVYNVILDCKVTNSNAKYLEPTVKALVSCFSLDETQLRKTLSEKKDSRYIVLLKKQSYEVIQGFVTLQNNKKQNPNINGVWFEEEYQRKYPLNSLASHVLGFTVSGNVGNWGIEQYYNDKLNGTNGREYGYLNADSDVQINIKEPTNGDTVVSTIDYNIQSIVEKHIEAFNEAHRGEFRKGEDGSKQTAVIVANPNTGEILAMANKDEFDLNNPRDLSGFYTQDEINAMDDNTKIQNLTNIWKNYSITNTYEPGSTAKPFTIAAGFESGKLNGNETYTCGGSLDIAGTLIHCNKRDGHGTQNLTQVLMNSCNVGLMQIGRAEGKDIFRKYQATFNLGMKTGIDLPGEETGILFGDNMGPVDLATNSFGQNFNVTMVQMVAGFSSIINGGYYYRPHVVSKILDEHGAVVNTNDSILLRQTVSNATSKKLRDMLTAVVAEGTGKAAKVDGYSMGGKTGTAEKVGRDDANYLVSFIGFVPANDPQVVIYTVVDEPNVESQPHSTYASELTRDILAEILPYLNIFPDEEVKSDPAANQTDNSATTSNAAAPADAAASSDNTANGATGNDNASSSNQENSTGSSTEDDIW